MRSRWLFHGVFGVVAGTVLLTWSLIQGQERPVSYTDSAAPVPSVVPAGGSPVVRSDHPPEFEAPHPTRDFSKGPPIQQQMYRSALRGSDWLSRANDSDGHFTYGFIPSLKLGLEGDHYLRQAGAAFALGRAARLTGDERQVARARQAVLLLLAETAVDPKVPGVRSTTAPSMIVNRLGAAGALLMAIHELPAPAEDLLQQSDQLCNFVRAQQQPDGSLSFSDAPGNPGDDAEGITAYPGAALYGLMLSQRQRPAPWKIEVARKALKHYAPWWRGHRTGAFMPLQTAAYVEAFLASKDPAFAEFVNEMSDWVSALQYMALDPRHPAHWGGGFMDWKDGRPVNAAPQIAAAIYAEGLAEACRLARAEGDLPRYKRYRETLERCLQFITRLQYTEANTQHFADWYRPALVGAFYVSFQDGNVRIDNTQHAVSALVQYLLDVVDKNES